MAEEKILLILGAGASLPYNFPLGRELLFQTAHNLHSTTDVQRLLNQMGHGMDEIKRFADELVESNQPSIDAFLYYRGNYEELGRRAMAAELITREHDKMLRRRQQEEWYEYLFSRLVGPVEDFPAKPVEVVTFNYDRSLERFIEIAVKSSYGVSEEEASALRQKIPIHHIYGDLGALGEEVTAESRPYTPELSAAVVSTAAKRICLLGGERSDTKQIAAAKEMVGYASKIAFLGFAFHPLNVKQLGIVKEADTPCIATLYQASTNERNRVKNLFARPIDTRDFDCISLLRQIDIIG
ncbi:MAG: hypothetical protein IH944_08630 [Armatimonadetes bacterium]|nr:hypothetical protein [Armatimonadota bacterium]